MATKLIGWTVEEYKDWAGKHPAASRTTSVRQTIPEEVRLDFNEQRTPKIGGYASVFNSWYDLYEGFREQVAPGAFSNTIQRDDIRALFNHDPNMPLGRTKAGTLNLSEDSKGLRYEIIGGGDRSYESDLIKSIKRGDVSQSSIGFNIIEQTIKYDKEKDLISRTLTEVMLWDVSPVTFPASPQTEVNVRMSVGNTAGCGDLIVIAEPLEVREAGLSDEQLEAEWQRIKTLASAPRKRQ